MFEGYKLYMYYGKIYDISIVDGPGVRVSLYVSGCRNHCKGCHNPEAQDFKFGKLFTETEKRRIFKDLDHGYIKGFTLCGGEPFEEENQRELLPLVREIKETFPDKDIWCWTGYEYEDLLKNGKKHCEVTDQLLYYINTLVTGPFILSQRDISDNNRRRGSRNQKIINLNGGNKCE